MKIQYKELDKKERENRVRAKISLKNGWVSVVRKNLITDEIETFDLCSNGVYVVDVNGHQICDGLEDTGSTLMSSKSSLLAVIRAEVAARRRHEQWYLRRHGR